MQTQLPSRLQHYHLLPMPNQISLPSVAEGKDLSMRVPGSEVVLETWFAADGAEFQVSLLNRLPGK